MKDTLSSLKRIYKYGKKYNKHFVCFTIGSINSLIINVVFPLVTAKQLLYITDSLFLELIYASIIVLIVLLFYELNKCFITKNTQYYFRGVTKDIQTELSEEILKISTKNFDETSSGLFIQRLTSDTEKLSHIFTKGMGYITGILTQVGIFIAVFILNWKIALYYLITVMIVTLIYVYYSKIINKKDDIHRKQSEKVTGLVGELIRGVRDIKMLNSKKSYMNNLANNIDESSKLLFDLRDMDREKNMVVWSLVAIFEFILIVILIYFIDKKLIAASTALIVFSYHNNIYENLMDRVDGLLTELKDFSLSAKRVFAILDNKEYEKETFGSKKIKECKGDFEFKNVEFSYNGVTNVLNGFSIKIDANKTYGIVGKSGEGKTTMFNLLCKMYDYNKGLISIDGIDINELDEDSIRGNITIISQNPYIFNMSIKDNLKLVKENITQEEIEEACKLACLDDFIDKLPNKYDTVVGEGGVNLSGGQRQRIAIARALVQKTKIILFDEATSALDNETQSKIQKAIDNIEGQYTIVIIAHRLSTIINCDKIFMMKDGKIVDSGTHKELLKSCKEYKKLCDTELIDETKKKLN